MKYNILIVGRDEIETWFLKKCLSEDGYCFTGIPANIGSIAESKLKDINAALVSDNWLQQNGFDLIEKLSDLNENISIIIISDYEHIEIARAAIKHGAYTFIFRPFDIDEAQIVIRSALEKWQVKANLRHFRKEELKKEGFNSLIAESKNMKGVISSAKMVAEVDTTILIQGESGVGKDRIAKAIHLSSSRADNPFIEVSCTAIPEPLLESELFGYEKGAYTGASSKKDGLFAMARGGTVFFNEIGDMPLALQAKILKLIENKSFRMVGGRRETIIDVRIICATCVDLKSALKDGKFRRDLYYRINVYPINIPPLRDRIADIVPLANHFVETFNKKFRKKISGLTSKAEWILKTYHWPGNVRELCNAIERIMITKTDGDINVEDIPLDIRDADLMIHNSGLVKTEKEAIQKALKKTKNNISKTAAILGIGRGALRYRIKKYGITEINET
jgi:DNA-binding NtrC family response regulator